MGSKDDGSSAPEYQVVQQQEDPMAKIAPMLAMMSMQNQAAANMSMPELTMPEYTSTTLPMDYEESNKKLQERIAAGASATDAKRKGVLGTIHTNLDDDSEPDAVKSSLLGGA